MTEEQNISKGEILALTTEIVSAHVANNAVVQNDVPDLIKSVTDDYIVCLEDGKKLKMLKRHLMTAYGMTPEEYRAKWGLRPDYPMVAASYSAQRRTRA